MSGKDMFTSPKRNPVLLEKLDMTPTSPPLGDLSMYPWNWGAGAHTVDLSPASSCSSPESDADRIKRGRPRAENITSLMMEGTKTESNIRCNICNRVFPREKSLQAHMRTHTGKFLRDLNLPNDEDNDYVSLTYIIIGLFMGIVYMVTDSWP